MSRDELQVFLIRYANNLLEEIDEKEIDLSALRSEIGKIKGIGEKRLDEIMAVVEKNIRK